MPLITTLAGASAKGYGGLLTFGGGTSFESIATTTVGSGGSATVTFSSIPDTYKHLQVRIFSAAFPNSDWGYSTFIFNSDSGSNYTRHQMFKGGSGTVAGFASNPTNALYMHSSLNATYFDGNIIDILDYTNTNKYKTVRVISGLTQGGDGMAGLTSGLWMSTSAVTSITFTAYSSFQQYSHFALYGIKGAA